MSYPQASYQTVLEQGQARFPALRPAQQRGLAEWVTGTLAAGTACEARVLAALANTPTEWHAARERLRAWLYDGVDRPAPCRAQVEVSACFAPLVAWVLSWWTGGPLPLALDATLDRTRHAAVVVSVLYRRSALPVGWVVLPANVPGAWLEPLAPVLTALSTAIPASTRVLLFADRGLWSPRLWQQVRALSGYPVLRIQRHHHFAPRSRRAARRDLGAGAGPRLGRDRHGVYPGAAPRGHPSGRVGGRAGRALSAADRSAAAGRRPAVVRAADVDRTRLSRAQADGLGVGAHPPHRSHPRGPLLAGLGRGDPLDARGRHAPRRRLAALRRRAPPRPERVSARPPRRPTASGPRPPLAPPAPRARALARTVSRPAGDLP